MVSQKIPQIVFILWVLILVMQSQFTAAGLSYSNKQQGRNIVLHEQGCYFRCFIRYAVDSIPKSFSESYS